MRLLTKRDRIRQVVELWEAQYGIKTDGSRPTCDPDKYVIYQNLCDLNLEECTEDHISQVIGNDSWTDLTCRECLQDSPMVVSMYDRYSDEPDKWYCHQCVEMARNLIREGMRGQQQKERTSV